MIYVTLIVSLVSLLISVTALSKVAIYVDQAATRRPRLFNPSKCVSGQSPLAVKLGWEEKIKNNYYTHNDKLYELVGDDFINIPVKTWADLNDQAAARGMRK